MFDFWQGLLICLNDVPIQFREDWNKSITVSLADSFSTFNGLTSNRLCTPEVVLRVNIVPNIGQRFSMTCLSVLDSFYKDKTFLWLRSFGVIQCEGTLDARVRDKEKLCMLLFSLYISSKYNWFIQQPTTRCTANTALAGIDELASCLRYIDALILVPHHHWTSLQARHFSKIPFHFVFKPNSI